MVSRPKAFEKRKHKKSWEDSLRKIVLSLLLAGSLIGLGRAAHAADSAVSALPSDLQPGYQNLDPLVPVGPSAYGDFKPKKGPPWTIGYASNYAGNTWRAAVMDRLMGDVLSKYQKAGLVKKIVVTQSNLDNATQIQQMRQMVGQGADAIIICCSDVTAMNNAIKYAHDRGVPVFSYSGYVTSPYAINVTENIDNGGYDMTKALAEQIGGKGNVLLVSGIPGYASSDTFDKGAMRAFKEYPNIKVVGDVAGKWTDQVAQVEVQKFLATHPEKLDGIVVQSAAEAGVLRAVLQSGRPLMPITLGGETGPSCYWRKHKDWVSTSWNFWPPGNDIELVFDAAIRVLEGQGPKIETITWNIKPLSYDEMTKSVPADCSVDANGWVEPAYGPWFGDALGSFYAHPHDPLTWKPGAAQ
jgi:ribose transport system substrate-binding protein